MGLALIRPAWVVAILLIAAAYVCNARPTSAPATAPARPSETDRQHVAELSRRAGDLIDQRKFAQAEDVLLEALRVIPDEATCLYDLACVHAGEGETERAMEDLERATAAGFTDFSHLQKNPAFDELRGSARFKRLLAREGEIRRNATQQILRDLKADFGPEYLYEVDEAHRLIFAAHTSRAALDEIRDELQIEATSQWEQLFSHKPDEFIRIVIATPADFARLVPRHDAGGYYDDTTRTVLVRGPGAALRHEFTHALHAADQHALGQVHPVWLSEGLATLYEQPKRERGDDGFTRLIPADTWRLAKVKTAARRGSLIPLRKLFNLSREDFNKRPDLAYGQAGSLLLYLFERGSLKKFYDAYTRGYAHDPIGRTALEQTAGTGLAGLQKQWVDWLLARPTPPHGG